MSELNANKIEIEVESEPAVPALRGQRKSAIDPRGKIYAFIISFVAIVMVTGLILLDSEKRKKNITSDELEGNHHPSTSVSVRRASASSELAALVQKYRPRVHQTIPKSEFIAAQKEILQRIDVVLPKTKHDQKLRFIALYLKARVLSDLDRLDEQRKALLSCLANCKDEHNNDYFEVVHCFLRLAQLEIAAKNFDKAEFWAQKAYDIVQHQSKDASISSLELPPALKYAMDPVWLEIPYVMAIIAENRKDYPKAIKYYNETREKSIQDYGTAGATVAIRGIADVMEKQGKKAEAHEMMLDLMKKISTETTKSTGGDVRQAYSLSMTAYWFYRRGEKKLALQCLENIQTKQKTHKLVDRALSKSFQELQDELESTGSIQLWDQGINTASIH